MTKQQPETCNLEPSTPPPAAGPWLTGEPNKEADYLIKFTTTKTDKTHISTGRYLPGHGWLNRFPGMTITEYAEIKP